jgi:hypothetical protein
VGCLGSHRPHKGRAVRITGTRLVAPLQHVTHPVRPVLGGRWHQLREVSRQAEEVGLIVAARDISPVHTAQLSDGDSRLQLGQSGIQDEDGDACGSAPLNSGRIWPRMCLPSDRILDYKKS